MMYAFVNIEKVNNDEYVRSLKIITFLMPSARLTNFPKHKLKSEKLRKIQIQYLVLVFWLY